MAKRPSWLKHPGIYLLLAVLGWGLVGTAMVRIVTASVNRRLASPEAPPATRRLVGIIEAGLAMTQSFFLGLAGQKTLALAASDRALQQAERLGDERQKRLHLLGRGFLLYHMNELSAAKALALAVAEESRKRQDPLLESQARQLLAQTENKNENYDQAAVEAEQARVLIGQFAQGESSGWSTWFLELEASALLVHQYQAYQGSPEAIESAIADFEATCSATGMPWPCRQFSGLLSTPYQLQSVLFERPLESKWFPRNHRSYSHLLGSLWPWKQLEQWPSRPIHDTTCAWQGVSLAPHGDFADPIGPLLRSTLHCLPLDVLPGSRAYRSCEATALEALRLGQPNQAAFDLRCLAGKQWTTGNFSAAIEIAATAAACFDRELANRRNWASLSVLVAQSSDLYFGDLFDMLWLERRYDEAHWVAERTRSRALLRSVGARVERGEAPPANPFSQELVALTKQIVEAEQEEALRVGAARQLAERRLGKLRRAQEGLLARAASLSPEFSSLLNPGSPTVAEIQRDLEPDVTFVSYFYRGRTLHAWVIDRDRVTAFQLGTSPDVSWTMSCYAAEVRSARRADSPCGQDWRRGEELYRQLFAPLRTAIRHQRLILVPHGPLHFLPFAALRDGTTGRTLVDDYTLTHLPSASILRFLRAKESPFLGRALVLGEPQPTNQQLATLPGSRSEAEAAAHLFGTTPRLGLAASEAALDLPRDTYDLIHIAAHGIHLPGAPRASHLALSPSGGHDGKLETHEIYSRLDLTGVNLVVLSACDTALGERSRGDDIVGLNRAFLYAGASGVVSTLWQVEDRASSELMRVFYEHFQNGASAAEALRSAQLKIRQQPGFEHPHFWAGFMLTGDPRARWRVALDPSRKWDRAPGMKAASSPWLTGERTRRPLGRPQL